MPLQRSRHLVERLVRARVTFSARGVYMKIETKSCRSQWNTIVRDVDLVNNF